MHVRPEPSWESIGGERCWTINWRALFKGGEAFGGEMCGFHVVFQLRINRSGRLVFFTDDGCIIRRNGEAIHCDRSGHHAVRAQLEVSVGDRLEIAQWQLHGDWLWGAYIEVGQSEGVDAIRQFLDAVRVRLLNPNGPPLKMYCHGRTPLRAAVSLYSMILNGYAPSTVHLYGDYQWSRSTWSIFAEALPFVEIVPLERVIAQIHQAGGDSLVAMARPNWFVMKSCVSLLCAPCDFCLMDDDLFILDDVSDALSWFRKFDFVFTPDANSEILYRSVWADAFGQADLSRTSALNTGLYWVRRRHEPRRIAELMLRGSDRLGATWAWEQGFFANLFANQATFRLPPQRYFYPLFEGLPGGIQGYDYALNPCGFASVHFGGPVNKPEDSLMDVLAPQILRRRHEIAPAPRSFTTPAGG